MLTRGRQKQIDEEQKWKFLRLPTLVINEILDYLVELKDLAALRATCKSTKSWIDDHPSRLVKFPVIIKNKEVLGQVLDSSRSVGWNNLVFTQTHYDDTQGEEGIAELLQKCGPWLKSLTVGVKKVVRDTFEDWLQYGCCSAARHAAVTHQSVTTGELLCNFLMYLDPTSAPQLESLSLEGEYRLETLRRGNSKKNKKLKKEWAKLLELLDLELPQVRKFVFKPHTPLSGDLVWPFVQLFLKACPNLNSIRIPALAAPSQLPPSVPQIENPFIAYLQALLNKPEAQRPAQFTLDFCSDRDVVGWKAHRVREFDTIFKLGVPELIELAKLAVQIGGKFWNVPLEAMVPFGEERRLGKQVKETLRATLGSVLCKNVTNGIGQLQYYFPNPNVPISVHLDLDKDVDYSNFDLPEDTNVQSICFLAPPNNTDAPMCWHELTGGEVLLEKLFKVVRPSVRALRMGDLVPSCLSQIGDPRGAVPYDLSHYFPNLTTLCIYNLLQYRAWDGSPPAADASYLGTLLSHIPPTLEELTLAHCTLNPGWFFTTTVPGAPPQEYQFILKQLKNLTKVSIMSCIFCKEEPGEGEEDELVHSVFADLLDDGLEALGLKTYESIDNMSC